MYKSFIFKKYEFSEKTKKLSLYYSLDNKINFTEEIFFDFKLAYNYNKIALESACFSLFIMAGISYFKTYLPKKIIIEQGQLTKEQADFFNKAYLNGLGEFFYKNKINPQGKINFTPNSPIAIKSTKIEGLAGSLLPIGGGKDSLVSATILKANSENFTSFIVNQKSALKAMLKKIGQPQINITRTISPKLIKQNQVGAYNGHVPISSIISFIAICTAILSNKQNIIFSNEASANEGNVVYYGVNINHQYSKSLEFEQDLQKYLRKHISPSLNYFSFLRPLSELKIAELFSKYCWEDYSKLFSSCNTNFKINQDTKKLNWCGHCPKCAFVFSILSPFVNKNNLIKIFNKNLYLEPELNITFNELLGNKNIKPFECVGQSDEVNQAFLLTQATQQYPELANFKIRDLKSSWQKLYKHSMPKTYADVLKKFLEK